MNKNNIIYTIIGFLVGRVILKFIERHFLEKRLKEDEEAIINYAKKVSSDCVIKLNDQIEEKVSSES